VADAPAFGVQTIELDLPAVAGAFGQRLHAAGVPMTPARLTDLARALALVRPISRRRLYWTARAVLVSDPTQVERQGMGIWVVLFLLLFTGIAYMLKKEYWKDVR